MKTVPWFDDIPDWSYIDSDNKKLPSNLRTVFNEKYNYFKEQ